MKQDKHIFAFAFYEMAMVQMKAGQVRRRGRDESLTLACNHGTSSSLLQYARARRMLFQAKDGYSGYEFEARVNFKVHAALNDLDMVSGPQKAVGQ